MSWQRWAFVLLVGLIAVIQYGLIALAARDMRQRARQGIGARVDWILIVVGIPIIGPLLYGVRESSTYFSQFARISSGNLRFERDFSDPPNDHEPVTGTVSKDDS